MGFLSDAQVLLLVTVLSLSGATKLSSPPTAAPQRPTEIYGVPVPAAEPHWTAVLRRNRPATVALALVECLLAAALVITPHPAARVAAVVLMVAITWVVVELRERTPDLGCGCFGELSTEPVSRRSVVRAALLAAAALGTLGGGRTALEIVTGGSWQVWSLFAAELALIAAVSPEPAELLRRRRRPPTPCDRRPSPLSETLSRLRRSDQWRRHRSSLAAEEPVDIWREGCWRFLVYPARDAEVVFAVSTAAHDRTVHAAVLADEDDFADDAPANASTPAADAALISSPEPGGPGDPEEPDELEDPGKSDESEKIDGPGRPEGSGELNEPGRPEESDGLDGPGRTGESASPSSVERSDEPDRTLTCH